MFFFRLLLLLRPATDRDWDRKRRPKVSQAVPQVAPIALSHSLSQHTHLALSVALSQVKKSTNKTNATNKSVIQFSAFFSLTLCRRVAA